MSVNRPRFSIARRSIAGMEGMYAKMWDPPPESPRTPEYIDVATELAQGNPQGLRPNPVPEFMESLGYSAVSRPHVVQRDLLHGEVIPGWDGKQLFFMTFRDADLLSPFNGGHYPGPTIRVPRGVIFQCQSQGHGPPPHTIHWHGHEPTPMNDGVGHCSMEIGDYQYQWQPNFIGTYFHHCHRNTVQHFEFGLFGMTLVETPDAYDPDYPLVNGNDTPVLGGNPDKNLAGYPRRTAASIPAAIQTQFNFKGINTTPLDAPDPEGGPPDTPYDTDPHAHTLLYDKEVLWVFDDRDSQWSDRAPNARAFYPAIGKRPGVDDVFYHGFFHEYNADYWFVTGVPVPAAKGGTGILAPGILVPPQLNSGVTGMQVSINATVGDTVLIRSLNAAYNVLDIKFPMDVAIIAWDGRALGVPPFGYSNAYVLDAETRLIKSVARRFDALFVADASMNGKFVEARFIDNRGLGQVGALGYTANDLTLVTVRIPITVTA